MKDIRLRVITLPLLSSTPLPRRATARGCDSDANHGERHNRLSDHDVG